MPVALDENNFNFFPTARSQRTSALGIFSNPGIPDEELQKKLTLLPRTHKATRCLILYRLICPSDTMGEMLERIIYNQLLSFSLIYRYDSNGLRYG